MDGGCGCGARYDARIEEECDRSKAMVDEYFDYRHMPTAQGRDIVQKEFKVGQAVPPYPYQHDWLGDRRVGNRRRYYFMP